VAAGPSRRIHTAPRWGDKVERANLGMYDVRTETLNPPRCDLVIDDDLFEQVQQILDPFTARAIIVDVWADVTAWELR